MILCNGDRYSGEVTLERALVTIDGFESPGRIVRRM
jgi:hypothetical protein